jgi:hypothetical protein
MKTKDIILIHTYKINNININKNKIQINIHLEINMNLMHHNNKIINNLK